MEPITCEIIERKPDVISKTVLEAKSALVQEDENTSKETTSPPFFQDTYLSTLTREKTLVSIYLTNGIKLQGRISGYDQQTILLAEPINQMVYKHAISTVVPEYNIDMSSLNNLRQRSTPRTVSGHPARNQNDNS